MRLTGRVRGEPALPVGNDAALGRVLAIKTSGGLSKQWCLKGDPPQGVVVTRNGGHSEEVMIFFDAKTVCYPLSCEAK